jgi:hypothetical protein
MKVVRLSALGTGRLYPLGIIPDTHFCQILSQTQGHSTAGRFMSMKNSNDTIGNRTVDLVAQCLNQLRHRVPLIYTLKIRNNRARNAHKTMECEKIIGLAYPLLTYSMEQSPSWEVNQFAASQEIPRIFGTRRFIAAFTSARHLSLSWASSIQSIPHIPIPEDPS